MVLQRMETETLPANTKPVLRLPEEFARALRLNRALHRKYTVEG
jgi:hypothetical protein